MNSDGGICGKSYIANVIEAYPLINAVVRKDTACSHGCNTATANFTVLAVHHLNTVAGAIMDVQI